MKPIGTAILFIFLGATACTDKNTVGNQTASTRKGRLDFNYDVKPILSDKCFACHGPDVKTRQAGLHLRDVCV